MIELTITDWLGDLSVPLFFVDIPEGESLPGIIYRVGSEFTPTDGEAPYGAAGYNIEISIWHIENSQPPLIAKEVRDALEVDREGYLVSVDDRGDYRAKDTGAYGIELDVQITVLNQEAEPAQQGLRYAVKQSLLNESLCASRVFASRIAFANCNQYPCAGVSIRDIDIETDNDDQRRRIELIVNVKTQSALTSENQLEQIVAEVESVLNPDADLFQESNIDLERISTEYTSVGRLHYEHRVVRFAVEYYQSHTESSDLHPFITAAADWDINQDGDAEAQDKVTLPQD